MIITSYHTAALVTFIVGLILFVVAVLVFSGSDANTQWMGPAWDWVLMIIGLLVMITALIILSLGYAK